VIAERSDEILWKIGVVAFAARFGCRDDHASRAGERLEERAAGAGRVHEDNTLGLELVQELRVIGCGEVWTRQIERRSLPVEAAVTDQYDDDLVIRVRAGGEVR